MKATCMLFALAHLLVSCSSNPTPKQQAEGQIAREGEERNQSLENRENRAGEMGDTQRQQNLENRGENEGNR